MATIETKERVPYRIWDKVNSKWNELRFKTSAKSVDADDGNTLETKIGAINGITSDLSGEAEDVAASIKCVNQLNNSLGGFTPIIDESTGKITGYKTKAGADTVFPFSGNFKMTLSIVHQTGYHDYNSEGYKANATTTVQITKQGDSVSASFISNPDAKYERGHADNIYYTFSKILSVTITGFELL